MRKIKYLLIILIVILFVSCSSTKNFVSDVTLSDIPLEEKFNIYGGEHVTVTQPDMYFYGDDWRDGLLDLIEDSNDYILLSVFLGSSCPTLEPVYEALEKKALEGVEVYVIADGISFLDMTESKKFLTPLNYLRNSGVHLLSYSPLTISHIINIPSLLIRDHRKLMVFDGKIAAIGGMNTNFISMGNGELSQRDSMYVFKSASLSERLLKEFVTIWNESSVIKMKEEDFRTYPDEERGYDAWVFNRNVYKDKVSISGMYGSLFNEAEESIVICPYLPELDNKMKESLKKAANKGVDVSMYVSFDSRDYGRKGINYVLPSLLEDTDMEFYDVTFDENGERLPLFHLKMAIVDDRYLVIGSTNFNYRSMALSHEISMVIDSPEIVKEAKREMLEVAGSPIEMTVEEARELKKTDSSWLCHLMTYFGG